MVPSFVTAAEHDHPLGHWLSEPEGSQMSDVSLQSDSPVHSMVVLVRQQTSLPEQLSLRVQPIAKPSHEDALCTHVKAPLLWQQTGVAPSHPVNAAPTAPHGNP